MSKHRANWRSDINALKNKEIYFEALTMHRAETALPGNF